MVKMCFRKYYRFFIHSYYYSLQTMNPQSTTQISEFEPDVDISLLVNTSSPANLETNSVLIIDISSDSGSVFIIASSESESEPEPEPEVLVKKSKITHISESSDFNSSNSSFDSSSRLDNNEQLFSDSDETNMSNDISSDETNMSCDRSEDMDIENEISSNTSFISDCGYLHCNDPFCQICHRENGLDCNDPFCQICHRENGL